MTEITAYAPGQHALMDFWGAGNLDDTAFIEAAMRRAAASCGATVLEVKLHHFGAGMGVTGVALLAESHISIHTWPETGFAALDIFVCGACTPDAAVESLLRDFMPESHTVTLQHRGVRQAAQSLARTA